MTVTTTTRFTIGGKTYNSVDEMPADVRAQYEKVQAMFADNDHNGIPDIAEGADSQAKVVQTVTSFSNTIPVGAAMRGSLGRSPSMRQLNAKAVRDAGVGGQVSWGKVIALLVGVAIVALLVGHMLR